VSNVENAKFGITSEADEETILQLMESVKGNLNYDLKTTFLNKREFATTKVRSTLKSLPPRADDLVFFYFTSSGFYTRRSQSKYPSLKLKGFFRRPISVDEIGRVLESKY
jgi:hypothetical protein